MDFSECSRASLEHAVALSERFSAPVDVLHVWELPNNVRPDLMVWIEGSDAKQVSQIASDDAAKQMDALLATLPPDARTRVTARLEGGDPIEAILRIAHDEPFDLIVMGTHGRRGLSHLLIGSVAEKVVRQAGIPVLTVRAPVERPR